MVFLPAADRRIDYVIDAQHRYTHSCIYTLFACTYYVSTFLAGLLLFFLLLRARARARVCVCARVFFVCVSLSLSPSRSPISPQYS